MTKTLLLDLDGTLVDSVPDLLASCNRVFAPRGLAPFTAAEVTPMVGDGAGMLVRRAFAARGREASQADLDDFLADYLAHVADHSTAFAGVADTLERLAGAGWTLAVCTNKPAVPARTLLDALGLLRFFAAVGGGDSYPVRKPDPEHLLATLRDAGGDPAAAVMVGDHHNDLAAASGAGLPCIFAAWGYGPVATGDMATAVASRFDELPDLAEACLSRKPSSGGAPIRAALPERG